MAWDLKCDWRPADNILFAHTSCLCLGIGMVIWSAAPLIVQRAVTGMPPSIDALFVNSLVFVLGLAFIGMHVLVRRGVLWAVWTAFLLSAMMAAAGIVLTALTGLQLQNSFMLFLSGWTCLATWLGIATLTRKPASTS